MPQSFACTVFNLGVDGWSVIKQIRPRWFRHWHAIKSHRFKIYFHLNNEFTRISTAEESMIEVDKVHGDVGMLLMQCRKIHYERTKTDFGLTQGRNGIVDERDL